MKLEVGKKYVTGDGEIVECIAVWTKNVNGYQATAVTPTHTISYTLDGRYCPSGGPYERDIVSEYKEPVKHKIWLVLYEDGSAYIAYSEENAKDMVHFTSDVIREIEWEVPQ